MVIDSKNQLNWKWDKRFMKLAQHIGCWSRHKQGIGCVIVGPDREIRSTGYNGFPRFIEETSERMESPEKHDWTEHAERNAIYNSARIGVSLRDCTLYVSWLPCIECSRAILQSGISRVVTLENEEKSDRWKFNKSIIILSEGKCKVLKINEKDLEEKEKLVKINLPPGWTSKYQCFYIEHEEDIWQASNEKLQLTIDVGWSCNSYCCRLVKNYEWLDPLDQVYFKKPEEVIEWTNTKLNKLS